MGKRKYQPDGKLEAFDDDGVDLAKKLKASSPSLCASKWETVAPALGLRADLDIAQLDSFTIPIAILPPSFHRDLMKNALQWMDVYQEPASHKRKQARVPLLDAVRMSNFLYVHL